MSTRTLTSISASIVFIAICALSTPSRAQPAKGVSVTVVPFEAIGEVKKSVAQVISAELESQVSTAVEKTISRDSLNADAFIQSCGMEVCEKKTTHRIRGSVSSIGTRYIIRIRLETTDGGKLVFDGKRTVNQDEDMLMKGVEDLARDVVECLNGKNCDDEPGAEFAELQTTDAPVAAAQATGLLKIASTPPGAGINIDNAPYGNAPRTVPGLSAGDHVVTLSLEGYEPVESIVTVKTRQTVALAKTLKEQQGQIEIRSEPGGANAFLDGKYAGKTPVAVKAIKTGVHEVKITLKSYRDYSETVQVAAGALAQVSAALEGLPGTLTVNSSPSGASVTVNGQNVGQTPWTGEVDAGDATIDLLLDGYEPQQKMARVIPGSGLSVSATLKKAVIIEMATIPAGKFYYHRPNPIWEESVQLIGLPTFKIDLTEVTVEQFERCVRSGACKSKGLNISSIDVEDSKKCNWSKKNRKKHPMNCVNWGDAKTYCEWAGKRLPTAWEWQKAARGTADDRTYPWGEQEPTCDRTIMSQDGLGCGKIATWPVCSKPNGNSPYGLCDMAGNVWEWTADWYDDKQDRRIILGGAWDFPADSEFFMVSTQFKSLPVERSANSGFRCAQDAK